MSREVPYGRARALCDLVVTTSAATSRIGSTPNVTTFSVATLATGRPVTAMTAKSAAVATHPASATVATIALNNEPAGLASHKASRPAGD
jgi:hypothetical protein